MSIGKALSASQWLVLDNLKHNWAYATNLDCFLAADAYLWCVRQEFIKDGKLTIAGDMALSHAIIAERTQEVHG